MSCEHSVVLGPDLREPESQHCPQAVTGGTQASSPGLTLKFKAPDPNPQIQALLPHSSLKAPRSTITDSYFSKHLPSKYKTLGRGVAISSQHLGTDQPNRSPEQGF